MKRKFVIAILIISSSCSCLMAQTLQYLNSNNIVAGIAIGGSLFTDSTIHLGYGLADLFQTKFDSGKAEIVSAGLWMAGIDSFGNVCGASKKDGEFGRDFYDGPIVTTYYSVYDHYYKRVWKITQSQIAQFRSLNFPTTADMVDTAILHWPGKGNPQVLNDFGVDIITPLAPFVDLNGNGVYEPLLGDYPAVCGDQSIFFVYNDIRGPHSETGCNPLGIEVRGLASSYIDTSVSDIPYDKRAINNTIFVQYAIENKSPRNYTGFDVAQYLDPDIGCYNNDYAGCDSARSLMFAYNGTAYDYDCVPNDLGYHALPVALGVQLLNQPMNTFGTYTGFGAPIPATSDPINCYNYWYYLKGLWQDGTPFEYGGRGYNTGGASTKFLFPGDPNDTLQWSMPSAGVQPTDVRMFGATDSLNFNRGQILHFDVAFLTSFDSTSNHLSIVDTVKRDADIVRAFYNNQILSCERQLSLGVNPVLANIPFTVSIYPNPSNNLMTIEAGEEIQRIELMDIEDRVLLTKTVAATKVVLPVATLAKGLYLLNVQGRQSAVVKKVVVQ